MFYKVKTNLSEFLVESETYKLNGTTAVFFDGMMATNIIKDVESVEPACKFQVGDAVNCWGVNGTIQTQWDSQTIDFGATSFYINYDGSIKGFSGIYIQKGHVEPVFKLHDRVVCDNVRGVVTEIQAGHLYNTTVAFDDGKSRRFTADGRMGVDIEPTLSLVTPQWNGLEAEYYNALIKAGASESAADYAVTKTLTSEEGVTSNFYRSLMYGFHWRVSPWGDTYWEDIHTAIQTPPSVKLQQLLSDKTPEIGDLVIGGDFLDAMYCVGVYTSEKSNSVYPYEVTLIDGEDSVWFTHIRCLNL